MENVVLLIEQRLKEIFSPTFLQVIDDSHRHSKHKGRDENKGNYEIIICSQSFDNNNRIQQHKMIYQALDDLMKTHIHALKINITK